MCIRGKNIKKSYEVSGMFRIRKKIFPSEGYEICEKKYSEFLEKKKHFIDDTLFRMFRHDYFHDGNLL